MRKYLEELIGNSCWARARRRELVFVLLGRDVAASQTIRFWAHTRVNKGKNKFDDPQIKEALYIADQMEADRTGPQCDRSHMQPVCASHECWLRPELPTPSGTSGVMLIAAERKRQIEVEGYTEQQDDEWTEGELAGAAAAYIISHTGDDLDLAHDFWPFRSNFKPKDKISDLKRAGALIAAEIDRELRMQEAKQLTQETIQ